MAGGREWQTQGRIRLNEPELHQVIGSINRQLLTYHNLSTASFQRPQTASRASSPAETTSSTRPTASPPTGGVTRSTTVTTSLTSRTAVSITIHSLHSKNPVTLSHFLSVTLSQRWLHHQIFHPWTFESIELITVSPLNIEIQLLSCRLPPETRHGPRVSTAWLREGHGGQSLDPAEERLWRVLRLQGQEWRGQLRRQVDGLLRGNVCNCCRNRNNEQVSSCLSSNARTEGSVSRNIRNVITETSAGTGLTRRAAVSISTWVRLGWTVLRVTSYWDNGPRALPTLAWDEGGGSALNPLILFLTQYWVPGVTRSTLGLIITNLIVGNPHYGLYWLYKQLLRQNGQNLQQLNPGIIEAGPWVCPDQLWPHICQESSFYAPYLLIGLSKWAGKGKLFIFFSFQTSLLVTMDSSGAIMLCVFPPDGGVMDTRWGYNITNQSQHHHSSLQDCTDGTDEKNCTAVSCPDNKFHCPQVSQA